MFSVSTSAGKSKQAIILEIKAETLKKRVVRSLKFSYLRENPLTQAEARVKSANNSKKRKLASKEISKWVGLNRSHHSSRPITASLALTEQRRRPIPSCRSLSAALTKRKPTPREKSRGLELRVQGCCAPEYEVRDRVWMPRQSMIEWLSKRQDQKSNFHIWGKRNFVF